MRNVPSLPKPPKIVLDSEAQEDVKDALNFIYGLRGRGGGLAAAIQWEDLMLSTLDDEANRVAGGGFHRAIVSYKGEPARRVNFSTTGGSPWAIFYDLLEMDGVPDVLYVLGVQHGSPRPTP